nr:ribosomal protein bL36 [Acinetobacter terrae]
MSLKSAQSHADWRMLKPRGKIFVISKSSSCFKARQG